MSWLEWLGFQPNEEVDELLLLLFRSHQTATMSNQNASSIALQVAASVDIPFPQAAASALLTLGRTHGPATEAREVIYLWSVDTMKAFLENGGIVPGWGNSFHKDSIDPAWADMYKLVQGKFPEHVLKLDERSEVISLARGREFFPNAAAFTAVAAEIVGLRYGVETVLLVAGRLPAWAAQYAGVKS